MNTLGRIAAVLFTTLWVSYLAAQEAPRPWRVEVFADPGQVVQSTATASGQSVQTSVVNGVKNIKAVDSDHTVEIVDDPDEGITMKVTKQYGPEDAEEIMDTHPELYMHLKAFPSEVGNSQVKLTVGVTTTYNAVDAEELESKHPEIHKLYAKYSNFKPGHLTGRIRMPRLVVPRPRAVTATELLDEMNKEMDRLRKDVDKMRKGAPVRVAPQGVGEDEAGADKKAEAEPEKKEKAKEGGSDGDQ